MERREPFVEDPGRSHDKEFGSPIYSGTLKDVMAFADYLGDLGIDTDVNEMEPSPLDELMGRNRDNHYVVAVRGRDVRNALGLYDAGARILNVLTGDVVRERAW